MINKCIYCYIVVILFVHDVFCKYPSCHDIMEEVFSWKQIGYDFDRNSYTNDTNFQWNNDMIFFQEELEESEKFFVQYNNVPIGMEIYNEKIFITVPRRRYGIPSTLNYAMRSRSTSSPQLKPYPGVEAVKDLVSVYRPRVDCCRRLWMVDTGMLEVPGARKQVQPPAIVVYDLNTNKKVFRYELKSSVLVDERTPAGLTSITIDVSPEECDDAYAYINDLATNGLIVFSLKKMDCWRIDHSSFVHEPAALNFTVAGNVINWKDGLFSITLVDPKESGGRRSALYHPLVSTHEYSVDTDVLKSGGNVTGDFRLIGSRGSNSQSGSHAYDPTTRTVLFANVARDAILCWNVDTPMTSELVPIVVQDHKKLVYISDLKVSDGYVWVLVNQIPRFVYSSLNPREDNYFIHRGNIRDLIRNTACDQRG